uniref:Uncharacterized protein n=1 Tax=Enterobacter cloacae TaxID=550 RepID=A0A2L1K6E5_ENTCL|nr:Hypothetical protein [Enterobacter cloacae]URZ94178.1 Hypothetical protein [Raoultella ornithinolytica]
MGVRCRVTSPARAPTPNRKTKKPDLTSRAFLRLKQRALREI